MMHRRHGSLLARRFASLIPLVAALFGCNERKTLRDVVIEAAELQKSWSTDLYELRQELARLDREGGLPRLVGRTLPPGDSNVAIALAGVIDPKLRKGILERSAALFPEGRFEFTPLELAEVREFVRKHRVRRERILAALRRPDCGFPVDFQLGFFYEPAFIDDVTIACRWLAFEAAGALAEGEVAAALRPVGALFRLSGCLGRERLLPARVRAAELRAEALLVVEALANHPASRRADLLYLFDVLQGQLDDWPPDEACLIGDRAMTLHAYECIRLGLLQWILTSDEKERFRKDFQSDTLAAVLEETIDQDELSYLSAMRRHVEACGEPYFRRRTVLVQLDDELNAMRMSQDRSKYPLLAATLFLPGLEEAHQAMARDRARCEAFALGLAEAASKPRPDYTVNPRHGRPYEIVRESQRVVVKLHEPDERDVVIAIPLDGNGE